jgi:hypothetical protein
MRFLRVRKTPSRRSLEHKRMRLRTEHTSYHQLIPTDQTAGVVPVRIEAGGVTTEFHLKDSMDLGRYAHVIARTIQRWLRKQYGTVIRLVSLSGDAKVRYHHQLSRTKEEIRRALSGILPQAA